LKFVFFAEQHFDARSAPLPLASARPRSSHPVYIRNIVTGFYRRQNFAQRYALEDTDNHRKAFDSLDFFVFGCLIVAHFESAKFHARRFTLRGSGSPLV